MLFADQINSLQLVPVVVYLAVGFILGDLIGLVPCFLARWKCRNGMAALSLFCCGVSGALFLPAAVPVAIVFSVLALVLGRWDPVAAAARDAGPVSGRRPNDAAPGTGVVGLSSARYLNR